jgi:hypothetical protein
MNTNWWALPLNRFIVQQGNIFSCFTAGKSSFESKQRNLCIKYLRDLFKVVIKEKHKLKFYSIFIFIMHWITCCIYVFIIKHHVVFIPRQNYMHIKNTIFQKLITVFRRLKVWFINVFIYFAYLFVVYTLFLNCLNTRISHFISKKTFRKRDVLWKKY